MTFNDKFLKRKLSFCQWAPLRIWSNPFRYENSGVGSFFIKQTDGNSVLYPGVNQT